MQEPLFLKPVFQEKIWGGSRLRTVFGFDIPNDKIGEDWAISAHPHGVSVVENGPFKGWKLDDLWKEHKELFGHPTEPVFPLLIKILDAEDDLSVQVHPDDAYGMAHEGELGKTECWYIIDAEPGAEIIYGHHAKTREELAEMIQDSRWDDLLKKVPVKKGDFFYVPSGTIHAIGKGIMILETQQSSDTTYRVYDYDRKDDQGNTRELHIQQSVDVTTVPAKAPELQIKEIRQGNSSIVTYVETEFFNVYEWDIKGITSFKKQAPYTLMTVIDGAGELVIGNQTYSLEKGTSAILPSDITEWKVQGELSIIASEPGKK
ncbi:MULTISPECIES: mannose-6-phosphate isomerase, class I [Enterococcus]|uniref:Mannose-6-phosphate isomerase n=1 Tax=Enterococcus mundtii TaxID=53346 RepID=A0A1V2UIH5_ENTMU|nr:MULTISPECIES: mannose-6-phosphate isomerase, class I [Enterococcus]MBE9910071.1 mannose-6-phosphate isomerase, class I [Enterococcus mundtii]MCA6773678.1 mannose-6-phosphate isomerase, class I [Enterococcus mundtii]MRI73458.1 mannose-6-phosphate isomerase, class I [Enterococcus mundtii]NMP58027.1 mannose-6-phosphate isomerase, class I [Enterococcus mundtii]ONN43163.1 mannose-6-phosphate isomerase, class I [Enterococcus mundtii]